MRKRTKIDREKLKLQNIKFKQKAAKKQAKSEHKQAKKKIKLRKKRQKKLNAKVDNLITVIAIIIFGGFAVVETLQNKKKEKESALKKQKAEQTDGDYGNTAEVNEGMAAEL